MKLIFCTTCHDIVTLRLKVMRYCSCERVYGRYLDKTHAEVSKSAVSIGIDNKSLINALVYVKKYTGDEIAGYPLDAFMRPNTGLANPNTFEI